MQETVIITMRSRPGQLADLAARMEYVAREARGHDGCLTVEILLAPDRDELTVISHWENADAFNAYLSWRAEQPDFGIVLNHVAEDPEIRSYQPLAAA